MSLHVGQHLGSYEITSLLGKGGMGEVYRAHDSKLKRDVAIKVLPEEFSRDSERVSRFQREAEVLAALNHQNIAAIHDLQIAGQTRFLVLEFVEGDSLAGMLAKRGALPADEAFQIASQICDALEAAHEKGIVHRDLKPANVKVMPDGKVKVLDFGLAKALEPSPANAGLSNSPTLSMAATNAGIILGTAAYMSPEQAKGRPVDRRTDIFAFGCVLYEMLAGRPAFDGDDVTEILGRVVTAEPDWSRLPAGTLPSIERLLRRALKKDARRRLGDIRDARIEIEEAGTEAEGSPAARSARGARLAWIVAAAAVLAAALFAVPAVRYLRQTPPPEMRVEIGTPSTPSPLHFALSPDGQYIVFVAAGDGPPRLWLRALDKTEAQPIAGTNGAEFPFWSADSRSIGFFAASKLYRIDIAGGPPQVLANAPRGYGGAWNADGTILFTPTGASPLSRVAASGGDPVAVTRLDPPLHVSHRFPQFLPDGRHFLFYDTSISLEAQGIYLGSLDGGEPKRLTAADTAGAYLRPDRVIFVRQGALVARRLDVARAELMGDPVTLADPVGYDAVFLLGGFSVSADGRVAYRGGGAGRVQLTWFDRTGKAVGVAGDPDGNNLQYPELSPSGRHVALQRTVQNNTDVFLMDLVRGGLTRFTFDAARDMDPLWSPDGTWIAFRSDRKGPNLYLKPSSGVGAEELLWETANVKVPQDWSRDGRFLLYYEVDPKTARDLWAVDMSGANASPPGRSNQVMTAKERKPRVVVNTPFDETRAQFSPDGRFVAYQTNEPGQFEIFVQPFPEANGKWQVSTGGGTEPRWRADGKELYFLAPDGKMMAVAVTAPGATFEAGLPVALFPTRIVSGGVGAVNRPQYAVSRDGRFLINQPVEESTASPITLILNWNPEEKR